MIRAPNQITGKPIWTTNHGWTLQNRGVRLLCSTQLPPLLPVHRRVPHPGLPLLAGSRSGGARRGGRPTGAESGIPRQSGRGAAQRHQEAQRRGEHCQLPL
jgi:hypothetical protein